MSDLILNIRFGVRHLQITWDGIITFQENTYWKTVKPTTWFKIYQIGSFNWD
jgi:hypothetical protein